MTTLEQLRKCCMAYESKLKELMGEEEFTKFSTELAKSLFSEEIQSMPDGDFKNTVLNNFEAITGTEEDYQNLMYGITGDSDDCGADY
jgi:hypothetical protein